MLQFVTEVEPAKTGREQAMIRRQHAVQYSYPQLQLADLLAAYERASSRNDACSDDVLSGCRAYLARNEGLLSTHVGSSSHH